MKALWTAQHQELLTQQALLHHRTSESSVTLLFLREPSFVPSGHRREDLLTCSRTVLTFRVSVRLSSIPRCHFVTGVNICVTHFHKYKNMLIWYYLITGMLCLFSDGSVIPRAGGVSLLGDYCWQLNECIVIAVWHKDGMVLVLSSANHVQKQK